jgi:hypothetical protein
LLLLLLRARSWGRAVGREITTCRWRWRISRTSNHGDASLILIGKR